jgi:hypothetical protein
MCTRGESISEDVRFVVLSPNGSGAIFSFAFRRSGFRIIPAGPIAIADGCSSTSVYSGMGFGGLSAQFADGTTYASPLALAASPTP